MKKNIFDIGLSTTIKLPLRRTRVRSVHYSTYFSRKDAKISQRRKGSLRYHFASYGLKALRFCVTS